MWVRVATAIAVGALAVSVMPSGVAADGVTFDATIGGRDIAGASNSNPLALHPGHLPRVSVRVKNSTSSAITIREVRLEGHVIGLTFFSYQTVLNQRVPAGTTRRFSFDLELIGLKGQAVGLLPATMSLHDARGNSLASRSLTVDVRGSLFSVYGLFGLAVFLLFALTLAAALIMLARHRLPPNRIMRGLRFAVPGLGFGLTITFALSALRLVAPRAGLWLPIVLGAGAIGFVVGYLTPTPESPDEDDEDDTETADDDPGDRSGGATSGAPSTLVPGPAE